MARHDISEEEIERTYKRACRIWSFMKWPIPKARSVEFDLMMYAAFGANYVDSRAPVMKDPEKALPDTEEMIILEKIAEAIAAKNKPDT